MNDLYRLPELIQTARYQLRRVVPDDAEAIFKSYGTDAIATRYLGWKPHQRVQQTSIRLDQAVFGVHVRSAFTSAFAISMSLRMMATMATFAGFPAAQRASYLALRSGLCLIATKAGI